MTKFTKASGIIGLIIIIISIVFIPIAYFKANHDEGKLWIAFLLFPVYFLAHFFVRFKFGFITGLPIDLKLEKMLNRISWIIMGLILIIVVLLPISYVIRKNTEANLTEKYSGLKTWSPDTSSFGQIAKLRTKFIEDRLHYEFTVEIDSTNRYRLNNIYQITIKFLDNDGFLLEEIALFKFNLNRIVDSNGNLIGYRSNSNKNINISDYSKFIKWNWTYNNNNNNSY
jgi:hypothetical protein